MVMRHSARQAFPSFEQPPRRRRIYTLTHSLDIIHIHIHTDIRSCIICYSGESFYIIAPSRNELTHDKVYHASWSIKGHFFAFRARIESERDGSETVLTWGMKTIWKKHFSCKKKTYPSLFFPPRNIVQMGLREVSGLFFFLFLPLSSFFYSLYIL